MLSDSDFTNSVISKSILQADISNSTFDMFILVKEDESNLGSNQELLKRNLKNFLVMRIDKIFHLRVNDQHTLYQVLFYVNSATELERLARDAQVKTPKVVATAMFSEEFRKFIEVHNLDNDQILTAFPKLQIV